MVDGRPIDAADFARLVAEVVPAADRVARRHGPPTEFELLTAVVFRHFAEAGLDLALVEVGLGGRLDATHAWDGGVAAITNVDLDHMDRLGPTIPLIAREKAAIIERGDLAVTGATGEALAVIRRRARRMGVAADRRRAGPDPRDWDRDGLDGRAAAARAEPASACGAGTRPRTSRSPTRSSTRSRPRASPGSTTPPAGPATRGATWPGRLELLDVRRSRRAPRRRPQPGRRRAPSRSRSTICGRTSPPGPVTLVTASMADKDVDGVIAALAASAALADARVIATTVDLPRAMPAAELADRWRAARPGGPAPCRRRGPGRGRSTGRWRTAAGPVVVAGSLYLVGAVRASWSTTRCCATRPTRPDDPRRTRPGRAADPGRAIEPTTIGPATFAWGARTYVMGILNVTPDSFSGDGLLAAGDPRGGRRRPGPPDGRRGGRPARHRRRVHPARPRRTSSEADELGRVVPVVAAVRAALPRHPDQHRHDEARRRRGRARRRRGRWSTTSGASARTTAWPGSPPPAASR